MKLGMLLISLAYSACAWAGLGKIYVRSNLGEVLRADIEMTGVAANELDAIRVGLADIGTFQALNVDYATALSSLRFALNPSAKGATIRVSSIRPINDPYLRFVVEARAPSGRSVREYTVLLDPANYNPGGQSIVQDVPSYADNDQASRYHAAAPAKKTPAVPAELRVRQGASLRSLALKVRPRGASLRQTMAALAQENPDAFDAGDVSHPKAGALLKVPSSRKIKAMTAEQVTSILGAEPASAQQQASGGAPAAGKGGDVLKLVPGDGADSARLNDLQQQINAREKALQDATARIAALEQQLKALQASGLVPPMKAASAPMTASASAPKPMMKPVEPPHPAAKPKPAHVAPPPPPPAPSLLDRIMENLPLVGGGVAALGLLGLLGAMILRRRAAAALDANASATLGRATVTGHGPNTVAGSNSFMSNFTQAAGAIDAAEVDPVAEAEVYIAYGRDQQAEEILKDALLKDPSRHEVRMKLMEVYAARPDTASFERLAREMQAAFDGRGVMWAKTVTLGRAIDPDNPLYQSNEETLPDAEALAPEGELIDLDKELFGSDAAESAPAAEPAAMAPEAQEEADPLAALFDAPLDAPKPAQEANMLDFDLEAMLPSETAPEAAKPAAAENNLLDFDFNLDAVSAEAAATTAEAAPEGLESLYADMLNEPAESSAQGSAQTEGMSVLDDPLATKLDLAKVYLDMGDREGAREVLQDLLSEAQGSLKDEAQALLDKISV
ncbi:hypothetical protein FYK34_08245 [Chromobacterium paludis]|uniref:FimV N-terminal domain-containing protein n=2 Tax=Chromobacterium paludis TaxID=2605945 RepID=A0A5C1DMR7_9NEIS|nr:hypothetical protein FYK34_08245 [Chromobacterium paludis]